MTAVDGEVFDLLGTGAGTRVRTVVERDGDVFNWMGVRSGRTRTPISRGGFEFSYLGTRSLRLRSVIRRDGETFDFLGPWRSNRTLGTRRNGTTFFIGGGGPAPTPTTYLLAAVDTGVGRRYWSSLTLDFASAPMPVGSWISASLTILGEWT